MWLDRIDAHTKNIYSIHTYMYINRWIIPTVYITDLGRLAEIIDSVGLYLFKNARK